MSDATSTHADRATILEALLSFSPPAHEDYEQEWRAAVAWALTQFDWKTLADRDLVPLDDENLSCERSGKAYALVAEQRVLFFGVDSFADSCDDALGEVGSWFGLRVDRRRSVASDGKILWDVRILRHEGQKHPAGCDEEGRYHRDGYIVLEETESPFVLWSRIQNSRAATAKAVSL